jgi:ABC-type phosphate transport system substrate-binding protein
VTNWNDDKLRAGGKNAALATVNKAIKVFRRTSGSSTTNFFTRYLHDSTRADAENCASDWVQGWGPAMHTDDDGVPPPHKMDFRSGLH